MGSVCRQHKLADISAFSPIERNTRWLVGRERSRRQHCHFHPAGEATPSRADRLVTVALRSACELVGVDLLDHVIVTLDGPYYSFAENEESAVMWT